MVTLKDIKKHYWACNTCLTEAGGVYPEGHCCTTTRGKCKICDCVGTLIPWVDYNWKKHDDDLFARLNRD